MDSYSILSHSQILQKIDRIAFQIVEDTINDDEVYLVGIANKGYVLAEYLKANIEKITPKTIHLIELKFDKKNSIECLDNNISLNIPKNQIVVLVDDVLNTGETLMHASFVILKHEVKRMRTVVLIDRRHRLFPIKADYAGLTLSTTLENHIEVEFENDKFSAVLN
ncbi:phosphoribosyltransferase family protein [Flavobacteriales bacterium]|jgi:pyrimidine operon attenuation protein / uracil phosphoribosyltransferase|nr:phosphoribosyltransferase family protein [Flavobacteriales bacterium]MDG1176507.1 phosphoribosyltransferase family protein [Flavobacteriales bacterium]